jgi:hypothetical protein
MERSGEFERPAPKLVVEVQYDHFTGGRFATARNYCAGGPTNRRGSTPWHR